MNPKNTFLNTLKDILSGGHTTITYERPKDMSKVFESLPQNAAPKSEEQRILDAIAQNETGIFAGDEAKRYAYRKFSGKKKQGEDLGKYQVTTGELKTYAKRYLGRDITADEFVKTPSAQDTYMQNKIKYLKDTGHTPEQIADIHRRGITKAGPAGSKVYQDPEYVANFSRVFYPPLRPQQNSQRELYLDGLKGRVSGTTSSNLLANKKIFNE